MPLLRSEENSTQVHSSLSAKIATLRLHFICSRLVMKSGTVKAGSITHFEISFVTPRQLCTKSQIPPALAAWSLSFALGCSFGVTVRYHLLQQRGVSIFHYWAASYYGFSEKLKLHAAEAGGITS